MQFLIVFVAVVAVASAGLTPYAALPTTVVDGPRTVIAGPSGTISASTGTIATDGFTRSFVAPAVAVAPPLLSRAIVSPSLIAPGLSAPLIAPSVFGSGFLAPRIIDPLIGARGLFL